MSIIDKSISHEDVIPVIESDVFRDHPSARFAVGVLAYGDVVVPGLENEYSGYFDLRRKVYVDQTGQLDRSEIQEDGTDRDVDDQRSVAFGIIENRGIDQRVVAATRLIIKGFHSDVNTERALPVEEFCPELFENNPVPKNGLEVSRLIARNEKAMIQEVLRWRIYAVALGYAISHELGPTLAVIEPWLEKHLKSTIPVSRIGEPRYIEHYKDYNLPIEVHIDKFAEQMRTTHPGMTEELQAADGTMTFFGKLKTPAPEAAPMTVLSAVAH